MEFRGHKILTAGCTWVVGMVSWSRWYLNLTVGRFWYRKREGTGTGRHSILQSGESVHSTAVGSLWETGGGDRGGSGPDYKASHPVRQKCVGFSGKTPTRRMHYMSFLLNSFELQLICFSETSYLIILCLSFLICNVGIIVVPTLLAW